jgi:apoptosis-inducing factor 3
MERLLGSELGDFIRALHEQHGVVFHLENTVTRFDRLSANLRSCGTIDAELVVMGIGVRPRLQLAEWAGLALDQGVLVNECLKKALTASMQPVTSRGGQTLVPARGSALSIG